MQTLTQKWGKTNTVTVVKAMILLTEDKHGGLLPSTKADMLSDHSLYTEVKFSETELAVRSNSDANADQKEAETLTLSGAETPERMSMAVEEKETAGNNTTPCPTSDTTGYPTSFVYPHSLKSVGSQIRASIKAAQDDDRYLLKRLMDLMPTDFDQIKEACYSEVANLDGAVGFEQVEAKWRSVLKEKDCIDWPEEDTE